MTSNSPPSRKARSSPPNYSAQEKAQAVLSVWTERCNASQLCRQMKLSWITFDQWQQRAMEGMLQALEPRVNLTRGQALSPRLQALLLKRQQTANPRKLAERLQQIQLAKPPQSPAKTE